MALVARPLAEVMIGEELRVAATAVTPWIALSALLYGMTAFNGASEGYIIHTIIANNIGNLLMTQM